MKRPFKLGMVAVSAATVALPILGVIGTQQAFADYAPSQGDIVGVGSDTLQYMIDFMADGDAYGHPGFNVSDPANKLVNIDATADANARLAFDANGSTGIGNGTSGAGACGAGSGGVAGTGSTGGPATGTGGIGPCVLNPTVVLRAGLQPAQRPNGSGAGAKALEGDVTDGTDTINFSRASGAQHPASTFGLDSIVVGNENVVMLSANGTSSSPTNAVALTAAQLATIYSATGTGCTTWNQVGGTSTDKIIPIIPQAGSGTRSFFETAIGVTDAQVVAATTAGCVVVGEENDPTAIETQGANAADAIEPMSQGRLNMYLGDLGSLSGGQGPSGGIGGYFVDPTCAFDANTSTCGTGTGANYFTKPVAPPVRVIPGAATFNRNLYIYFRNSDITSSKPLEPGGTENWLNSLFYDPCTPAEQTAGTCETATDAEGQSVQYGPAGMPFIDKSSGVQAILDAGVTPVDPDGAGSFVSGGI